MTKQQVKEAKYLYCLIKCGQARHFNGITGIGGGGDPVHTVIFRDLACVVSDSPDVKYDCTRANMMAHETVIERVMRDFTVLPIRFGTIAGGNSASSVSNIGRLLESRYDEFLSLHDEISPRVELGLKALWRDQPAIYEEIVNERREIHKLRDAIRGKPPQATHFERMRLGEMVKKALEEKRARETKILLSCLRPLTDQIQENGIIMDRMVLNAALLVNKEREKECDEVVNGLDAELGKRIAFQYIGPVPPFNFCQITVNWEET